MTVKEITENAGLSSNAVTLASDDSTPASYLDGLEKQELYPDAIRVLAYKLTTDAGVKWAIACIHELQSPEDKQKKDEPLEAAEQWAKAPNDVTRRSAKDVVDKAETRGPSSLVAMAVFFSGGSVAAPSAPETPPPPYTAQKMIAGCVQVTIVSHDPKNLNERYKKALALGKLV